MNTVANVLRNAISRLQRADGELTLGIRENDPKSLKLAQMDVLVALNAIKCMNELAESLPDDSLVMS